jgi:hypothetical protein
MKSGNLNFLEPSGPLHACNGTAFLHPEGKEQDTSCQAKECHFLLTQNSSHRTLISEQEFTSQYQSALALYTTTTTTTTTYFFFFFFFFFFCIIISCPTMALMM